MQTQKAKNNTCFSSLEKETISRDRQKIDSKFQNLEVVKEARKVEDLSKRDLALSPLLAKTLYIA